MEKCTAQKEYDNAAKKCRAVALVFTINAGNIEAKETVTIKLRYVQALTDDETRDQVRFTFLRIYTQRYGTMPTFAAASPTSVPQALTISVIIPKSSTIKGISVPLIICNWKWTNLAASTSMLPFPATVLPRLLSSNLLAVQGSSKERYIRLGSGLCSSVHASRYLEWDGIYLLVDRSSSMAGTSMKLVQETLIALRGLPTKEAKLSFLSFGTNATKL
ncbi:hypothetical protein DL96DRAFT_1705836 [Flagelloscypha sp. PMI_526]|nr:hypothetical protein DL96DRAFT_1705836 [Flagelloscypha sp. PMI_526]